MSSSRDDRPQSCTKQSEQIHQSDLPLSCPPRDDRIWDAHPRVFLPIEETGREVCPYCGTVYELVDFKPPLV